MRIHFLTLLFVVVPLVGCGRAAPFELEPEAAAPAGHARVDGPSVAPAPAPKTKQVRLTANFQASEGFRFVDQQLFSSGRDNQRCGPVVVRDAQGTVVEGEAARVDVQTSLGRLLALSAVNGKFCQLATRVGTLREVDATACTGWDPMVYLYVNGDFTASAEGLGLVLRTERDGDFRLRVIESGRETDLQFVRFEYEPLP